MRIILLEATIIMFTWRILNGEYWNIFLKPTFKFFVFQENFPYSTYFDF